MKLQTHVPLKSSSIYSIDYNSSVLLLGSCFSEHIGNKFSYYKFKSLINPFGILFHPLAIEQLIEYIANNRVFSKNDIFLNNEMYHCFDAHSSLSNVSEDKIIETLNRKVSQTANFLKGASHIIITLGTAWAYRNIEQGKFIANCHKVEQKKFDKELLTIQTITQSLKRSVRWIKNINSNVAFIFTVSPVRHLKDGFIENTKSKSYLIAAVHELLDSSDEGFSYFPAYEIMMDELRDYRFYAEDMLHPNQTAIAYIWDCFQKVHIASKNQRTGPETQLIMKEIEQVQTGLNHRPINSSSAAHQKFLQRIMEKQKQLGAKYPHIKF